MSVDRVLNEKIAYSLDLENRQRKQVLQENVDNFVQTFKGDTLKWAHNELENKIE